MYTYYKELNKSVLSYDFGANVCNPSIPLPTLSNCVCEFDANVLAFFTTFLGVLHYGQVG